MSPFDYLPNNTTTPPQKKSFNIKLEIQDKNSKTKTENSSRNYCQTMEFCQLQ